MAKVIQLKARLPKETTFSDLQEQGVQLKAKPCIVDKTKARQSFISPNITFIPGRPSNNGPDLVA